MTSVVRVTVDNSRGSVGRTEIATAAVVETATVRPTTRVSAINRGRASYTTRSIRNREENSIHAVDERITATVRGVRCVRATAAAATIRGIYSVRTAATA